MCQNSPLGLKVGMGDGEGTQMSNIKGRIENDTYLINYAQMMTYCQTWSVGTENWYK